MADKKAPADGWPVISGDYIVGDPESPVAVTTLASHIEGELSGAAIAGPCKTENLGIEKAQVPAALREDRSQIRTSAF